MSTSESSEITGSTSVSEEPGTELGVLTASALSTGDVDQLRAALVACQAELLQKDEQITKLTVQVKCLTDDLGSIAQNIASKADRVANLESRVMFMGTELEQRNDSIAQLTRDVQFHVARITTLQKDVEVARHDHAEAELRLNAAFKERETLTQALAERSDQLNEKIAQATLSNEHLTEATGQISALSEQLREKEAALTEATCALDKSRLEYTRLEMLKREREDEVTDLQARVNEIESLLVDARDKERRLLAAVQRRNDLIRALRPALLSSDKAPEDELIDLPDVIEHDTGAYMLVDKYNEEVLALTRTLDRQRGVLISLQAENKRLSEQLSGLEERVRRTETQTTSFQRSLASDQQAFAALQRDLCARAENACLEILERAIDIPVPSQLAKKSRRTTRKATVPEAQAGIPAPVGSFSARGRDSSLFQVPLVPMPNTSIDLPVLPATAEGSTLEDELGPDAPLMVAIEPPKGVDERVDAIDAILKKALDALGTDPTGVSTPRENTPPGLLFSPKRCLLNKDAVESFQKRMIPGTTLVQEYVVVFPAQEHTVYNIHFDIMNKQAADAFRAIGNCYRELFYTCQYQTYALSKLEQYIMARDRELQILEREVRTAEANQRRATFEFIETIWKTFRSYILEDGYQIETLTKALMELQGLADGLQHSCTDSVIEREAAALRATLETAFQRALPLVSLAL
ncbi:Coiled-coil protein [Giardia muris]|uniref:Coiled-coil protein n=1 Tax=Giardia muris TaxID=5742 RepID=A0A4Z1T406_GIAMU|nr:Coiled-coil protein [Giardia muris]|eukprot:TNJ28713.1 Coiled-coil protein [Giardia muris]